MKIQGWLYSSWRTSGNQVYVGYTGISNIPFALSCIIFCTHFGIRLKGEKAKKLSDHSCLSWKHLSIAYGICSHLCLVPAPGFYQTPGNGLASHADVLRGSSRVRTPKNVCGGGYARLCMLTNDKQRYLELHIERIYSRSQHLC